MSQTNLNFPKRELYETEWRGKEFVFIYPKLENIEEFLRLFEENKGYILSKIEEKFGEFLFKRVYIIFDSKFKKSYATTMYLCLTCEQTEDKKSSPLGFIAMKYLERGDTLRKSEKILGIFIHELCHLTEKGNFPAGSKDPETIELHKQFDVLANELVKEITRVNLNLELVK